MRKTVALTLLVSLATGCQRVETQGQQDRIESLRCWYLRDQHVTPDDLDFIRKRSKAGDLVCRQILGHMNERGIGMPVNLAEARAIYLSVAAVHSAAYIELARMAEQGVGEPVDFTRARALYAQAGVQEGSGAGTVGLARLLEEGKGGLQDPDAALALYLSGMKRYRDPAWLGIQRLRAQGAVLSEEQALKCNTLWFAALRGALAGVDFDLKRKLSRQMDLGSS